MKIKIKSVAVYCRQPVPKLEAQYTPPTRLNCRVKSRRRCVPYGIRSLVGDSLDEFEVGTNLPTAKSSCIVSAAWTHPSAVVTQVTIFCAVGLLRFIVTDKWRHNDVIVEKVININQNSRRQTAMESGQFPNCRPRPYTTDADATQLSSCVASAVCIVLCEVLK